MIVRDLIYNIALVVSLSVVLQFMRRRLDVRSLWGQLASGMLFGGAIVLGMMTPVRLLPGLIFDGRSIVLVAAGVLGGPIVAGVSAIMGAAYRVYLGGGGTLMGVLVILESAAFGTALYFLRMRSERYARARNLYALGLVVHVVMVLLMFTLPGGMSQAALMQVAPIVLTAYPIGTVVVCRYLLDDEQRMVFRRALADSEERLKLAIEGSGAGLWDWRPDVDQVTVNGRWAEMLGYTCEDLGPMTLGRWEALVHPADLPAVTEALEAHLRGAAPSYEAEMRMRHKNGSWVWIASHGSVVMRDAAGRAMRVAGTHLDVTARHEAADAIEQSNAMLERMVRDVSEAMGKLVEARDPYTQGHQRRVAQLARAIARSLGLSDDATDGVELAALLHDVGKTAVPAEILTKPGALSEPEFAIIRVHPEQGHDILRGIAFRWPIAEIVLQHHERMDGSGYPAGLSGEEILLESRIIAVADVVEAMASHRPYRGAKGLDAAMDELASNPHKYDPGVVSACLGLYRRGLIEFAD